MLLQIAFTLVLLTEPGPLVTMDSTYAGLRKVDPTKPWFAPLPVSTTHRRWWAELARCQGLKPFTERVPRLHFYVLNSRTVLGRYLAATLPGFHQIYFATGRETSEALVKHEMLHQLLHWNGKSGEDHPDDRFHRCGVEMDFDPIRREVET